MVVYKFKAVYNIDGRLVGKCFEQPESVEYTPSQGWWGFPKYRVGWDPKYWCSALVSVARGSDRDRLLDKLPVEELPLFSWLRLVLKTSERSRDIGDIIWQELRTPLAMHAESQLAAINRAAIEGHWPAEDATDYIFSIASAYRGHAIGVPCGRAFLVLLLNFGEDWSNFVKGCSLVGSDEERISFQTVTEIAYELKRYMIDHPFALYPTNTTNTRPNAHTTNTRRNAHTTNTCRNAHINTRPNTHINTHTNTSTNSHNNTRYNNTHYNNTHYNNTARQHANIHNYHLPMLNTNTNTHHTTRHHKRRINTI